MSYYNLPAGMTLYQVTLFYNLSVNWIENLNSLA